MTLLREAVFNKNPEVILTAEVEFDEVYVTAGRNRLKSKRGRGKKTTNIRHDSKKR